ncbi:MAG: TIGR02677 family protein [Opitutaceae bacterium]
MSFSVFAHLNVEKSALYRAILGVFVAERARFVISLRPTEVLGAIIRSCETSGLPFQIDEDVVQTALQQLRDWGNLDDTRDNADAASIEEFYQRRRLYQLSAAGEAAEQAIAVFDEYLHRPGELQTTALQDISELLDALLPRLADAPLDDAKLHHLLGSLVARFEQLTSRAQSFMRGLQSTVELHGITVEAFLVYKEKLIDYLEKFIGELIVATSRISDALLQLEACGVDVAFAAAARRELADALDPAPDAQATAEARWRDRWAGLRQWFIATETASQAELLRARARSAIPALLTAVAQINDRRASRADRATDFSTLARWFAGASDEAACHRLWRAAFALSPARHLRINSETLNERAARGETPRTSWLEAAPIWLSPRLRQHGRNASRGSASATIDRSADKARLRDLAREQAAQIERARQHLVVAGRCRLAALGPLDEPAFRLFLELLGHALTLRPDHDGSIDVESADGALHIRLDPVVDGDEVTLRTAAGDFRGRDHWITIEPTSEWHAHPADDQVPHERDAHATSKTALAAIQPA